MGETLVGVSVKMRYESYTVYTGCTCSVIFLACSLTLLFPSLTLTLLSILCLALARILSTSPFSVSRVIRHAGMPVTTWSIRPSSLLPFQGTYGTTASCI